MFILQFACSAATETRNMHKFELDVVKTHSHGETHFSTKQTLITIAWLLFYTRTPPSTNTPARTPEPCQVTLASTSQIVLYDT